MNQEDTVNRIYEELVDWNGISPIYSNSIKVALQRAYGVGFDKGRRHKAGCKRVASYDKRGNKIHSYPSIIDTAKAMKCHKATISKAIRKRTFSKGYYWVIEH